LIAVGPASERLRTRIGWLDSRRERLTLVASRDGRDGSVTIHQDVAIFPVCSKSLKPHRS
jgi:hypothetical protein